MTYFDLYELPVGFQVNQAVLKKKFYALSRHYHPDYHTHLTEPEQREVLEKSSMVNKAYHTFAEEDETIRYVLEIKGLLEAEEKYRLDPEFLMEVMDINEELMELELDETREQLMNVEQKTNRLLLKIYDDVAGTLGSYQEGITSEEELLRVKDFYYRKKYLQRILDRIGGIRNIVSPQ